MSSPVPGIHSPDSDVYDQPAVHITLVYAIVPEDPITPCFFALFLLGIFIYLGCSFRMHRRYEPTVIQADPVPLTERTNHDIKMIEPKV